MRTASLVTVALLALACSSSRSRPVQLPPAHSTAINFGACQPDAAVAALLDEAMDSARGALGPRLSGYLAPPDAVVGVAEVESPGGVEAAGRYYPRTRTIAYRCGSERAILHEMQHHACSSLRLPCDCTTVDHAGGPTLAECAG